MAARGGAWRIGTRAAMVLVGFLAMSVALAGCSSGSGDSAADDGGRAGDDDDTGPYVPPTDDDATDDDDDDASDDDTTDDDTTDDDTGDDDSVDPDGPQIAIVQPAHNASFDTHEIAVEATVTNANPDTIRCFYNTSDITSLLTINQDQDRGFNFIITGTIDGVPAGTHRFAVQASNDEGSNQAVSIFDVESTGPYLELTMASHLVEPGDNVTANVTVFDENGAPVSASYTYSVQPATGFTRNGDVFTFDTKGAYTITATAQYGDKAWLSDEETVEVKYLTPTSVTVMLSASTTQAGTPVVANSTVFNADNEPLDGFVVAYTVTPGAGVTVDGNVITLTKTGSHNIKGTVQGFPAVNQTKSCDVTPGPAAAVDLTLSRSTINAGQSITWSADVEDAYGNAIDGSTATLTVTPNTGVSVVGDTITFNKARVDPFVVKAQYTFLYDEQNVQVNDKRDPRIVWTAPDRGTVTNSTGVSVQGQVIENESSVASFTINGEQPQSFAGGIFSHVVQLEYGLNIIVAEIEDAFGNTSNASISVIRGNLLDVDDRVESIVGARINDQGFNQIELLAADLLAAFDIDQIIQQLYDDGTLPLEMGTPGQSGYVYADFSQIEFGTPQITLEPEFGMLAISATLPNIDIVLGADIVITTGQPAQHFDIDITGQIGADISVLIDVVAGELVVSVDGFTLNDTQLDVSLNGFPLSIEALIKTLVGQLVGDLLENELPQIIEELLGDLDLSFPVDLLDVTFTFGLDFETIDFEPTGATIWLGGNVTKNAPDDPNNKESCYSNLTTCGSLLTPGLAPDLDTQSWDGNLQYGFGLAVGDDYINRALYQFFRAGIMNFSVMDYTQEQGGTWDLRIDNPLIQLLVPDLDDMFPDDPDAPIDFVLDPQLPPVVNYTSGSRDALGLELQMGDLLLDMVVRPEVGDPQSILGVAVALRIPLTVGIDTDTQMLSLGFGDPLVVIDVYDEDFIYFPNELLEDLIPQVIEIVLPLLTDLIGEFPIPTFSGLAITIVETSVGGSYDDFLGFFTDLTQVP